MSFHCFRLNAGSCLCISLVVSYRSTIKLLNRLLRVFSQDEAMLRMFIDSSKLFHTIKKTCLFGVVGKITINTLKVIFKIESFFKNKREPDSTFF